MIQIKQINTEKKFYYNFTEKRSAKILFNMCCLFAKIFCGVLLTFISCKGYEKDIPPPKIYFKNSDSLIETRVGDTIYLSPKITYNYDSQYKWYKNNEEISTELNIMHVSKNLGETKYSFVVKTQYGKDSVPIIVRTIEIIDFNNFTLNENTYNTGEKLQNGEEGFIFGNLFLPNLALPDKKWEGFAMSNMYATSSFPNDTIYSVYGTTKTNKIFAILSLSQHSKLNSLFFQTDSAFMVGSIDVCNTTRVYNMIVYGNEAEIKPFKRKIEGYEGDFLFLRFQGLDNKDNHIGTVDFYLADYRFEKNGDVIVIKNFTPVDLSPLGFVNKIVIEMFCSLNDFEGKMFLPQFVCLDNVKIFDKKPYF